MYLFLLVLINVLFLLLRLWEYWSFIEDTSYFINFHECPRPTDKNDWPCKVHHFLWPLVIWVSNWLFAAITIERLLYASMSTQKHNKFCSRATTLVVCVVIMVIGFSLNARSFSFPKVKEMTLEKEIFVSTDSTFLPLSLMILAGLILLLQLICKDQTLLHFPQSPEEESAMSFLTKLILVKTTIYILLNISMQLVDTTHIFKLFIEKTKLNILPYGHYVLVLRVLMPTAGHALTPYLYALIACKGRKVANEQKAPYTK